MIRRLRNREEAGRLLAERLAAYREAPDVVVLALPRGGVPVGFEIARALRVPFDVFIVRKLGVPGYAELAMGAIATGGMQYVDRELISALHVPEAAVKDVVQKERAELQRREKAYRGERAPLDVRGRTVILVDDGVATGASLHAALGALRKLDPARIVVAVGVAPLSTWQELRTRADEVVCLLTPQEFWAVSLLYEDFGEVSDEEVCHLLEASEKPAGLVASEGTSTPKRHSI
jgi:putative phosphoribosyl transferase